MAYWPGARECADPMIAEREAKTWATLEQGIPLLIEYALMASLALTAPMFLDQLLSLVGVETTAEMRREVFLKLCEIPKCDVVYVAARSSPFASEFLSVLTDRIYSTELNQELYDRAFLRAPTKTEAGAYAYAFLDAHLAQFPWESPILVRDLTHAMMFLVHFERPETIARILNSHASHKWQRDVLQKLMALYQQTQAAGDAIESKFVAMEAEIQARNDDLVKQTAHLEALQLAEELKSESEVAARTHLELRDRITSLNLELRKQDAFRQRERTRTEQLRVLIALNALYFIHAYYATAFAPTQLPTTHDAYNAYFPPSLDDPADLLVLQSMYPHVCSSAISRAFIEVFLQWMVDQNQLESTQMLPIHTPTAEKEPSLHSAFACTQRPLLALECYRDLAELDTLECTPIAPVEQRGVLWTLAPCHVPFSGAPPECRTALFERLNDREADALLPSYCVLARAADLPTPHVVTTFRSFVYLLPAPVQPANRTLTKPVPFTPGSAKRHFVVWLMRWFECMLWKLKKVHKCGPLPLLLEWSAPELHESDASWARTIVNVHFSPSARCVFLPLPDSKEVSAAEQWVISHGIQPPSM